MKRRNRLWNVNHGSICWVCFCNIRILLWSFHTVSSSPVASVHRLVVKRHSTLFIGTVCFEKVLSLAALNIPRRQWKQTRYVTQLNPKNILYLKIHTLLLNTTCSIIYNVQVYPFFILEMHMGMLNYILIKFQKVMSFVCHKLIIRILFI